MNHELNKTSQENANKAGRLMTTQGFECVFEYKVPSDHRGAIYYAYWVDLQTGKAAFTMAQYKGFGSYRLVPDDGRDATDPRIGLLLPEYEYCLEQIKAGDAQAAISRLELLIKNINQSVSGTPDNVVPMRRAE